MQRSETTRRLFLLGTGATVAALAGCSGSDSDGGGEDPDGESGPTTDTGEPTATSEPSADDGSGTTPNNSPAPDCTRLTGQPTGYDAADTPFVFTFDYVDSWTVGTPLEGPGGRSQAVTSPIVSVDGEPESAGIRVGQRFEPLTATQVDAEIADAVSGQYSPFEVVHELEYAGETVRIVGFPDAELGFYRLWLPHEGQYYPVEIDVLSSILRFNDQNEQELLCLDPIQTATETVRTSLRPNPATTIDSV
ncbi:MAG: hypothetical protein V5A41_04590 [Haloarculaceae archaeon]